MRRNVKQDPGQSVFVYVGQPETVRPGQVYRYQGKPYAVGLRNDCRARLDPLWKKRREIVSRLHDIRRTRYSPPPSVNLSANTALCPILDV